MDRRAFLQRALAGGAAWRQASGRFAALAQDRVEVARDDLSEHRIASMESRMLRDRYPRTIGRNSRGGGGGNGASYQIRVITTDRGIRGWGMSHVPDEEVRKFLGAKVADLFDASNGTAEVAYSLDIPLHDLAGQILGRPVHALLGSHGPQDLDIYSGAIYFDDLDPVDQPRGVAGVLASCRQDYEAGYRAFKLKIGRGARLMARAEGDRRDVEVTRAVREAHPDCKILVDANDGYSCPEFLGYLCAVADCDLYWIEEPFVENRQDLLRLREEMTRLGCRALIVEGETRTGQADPLWRYGGYTREHIDRLYDLAREKLIDVFLLDLGIVGFTRWRHIMPELVAAGVTASPHTWAWTPRPHYVAQLAAGLGNVVIVEGIPGAAPGIDYSAYRFSQGRLVVSDLPGFGLRYTGLPARAS